MKACPQCNSLMFHDDDAELDECPTCGLVCDAPKEIITVAQLMEEIADYQGYLDEQEYDAVYAYQREEVMEI